MRFVTWTSLAVLLGIFLAGCGGSDKNNTQSGGSGFTCSAAVSGTITGTNLPLSVTASGGTAPYTLSLLTLAGVNALSVSGVTANFAGTTVVNGIFSTAVVAGSTGIVSISDSSNPRGSTSCSFAANPNGSGGGGTSPICTMTHTISGSVVTYFVNSSTGGAITLSAFSPGDGGSYSSLTYPVSATYSTSGTKLVTATALSGGVLCNGTGSVTDSIIVGTSGGGGGSSLACQAVINPNPSFSGNYVNAYASILSGSGATLQSVAFPTNAYVGVTYTGDLSAQLYFPYPGVFPITLTVRDAFGYQTTCQSIQTVY